MVIPLVLTLIGALVVLVISGRLAITSLTKVTAAFGVSEYTVAFVILALATSMPELFVAVSSSLQGASAIILSTVLGSNIANITLIIGLTAILSGGISTTSLHLRRDIITSGAITLLPLAFILNGVISRVEGVILLGVFAIYLIHLLRDQSQYSQERLPRHVVRGVLSILGALAMVAVLIFAADTTVNAAVKLAELVNVPAFLIGLFLLSIGTSLPELITTLHSNRNGSSAMALGNIIGSNISNSSLIIGIASVISPIRTTLHPALVSTMLFVVLSVLVMGWFASREDHLSIKEGFVLVGCFVLFGAFVLGTGLQSI